MAAVSLALLAALCFGTMVVVLRQALRSGIGPGPGTLATSAVALAVAGVGAAIETPLRGVGSLHDLGLLAIAGLLAPGASQLLFTHAVRLAGPSRVSVVAGSAPLLAVLIALTWLREPFRPVLTAGTVLVVAGGVALAVERRRPESFRAIGLLAAFAAVCFFATRDNLARLTLRDTTVAPLLAATIALAAGTALLTVVVSLQGRGARGAVSRRSLLAFVPAGLLFGSSYAAMFEAYDLGRVTVVSPIIAMETLFGVLLSALVVGKSELVGRHVLAGAALIVAGGALIGVFR
jgi:drug/metabolite transporter (DMT)-like permease